MYTVHVATVNGDILSSSIQYHVDLHFTYWNNNTSDSTKHVVINKFNPCSTCTSTGVIACTERACVDICSLSAQTGDCRGYFPSYFYNHTSMRCERFIYGGCGGNQNRFSTTEECYLRCNPCKFKSNTIVVSHSRLL